MNNEKYIVENSHSLRAYVEFFWCQRYYGN